MLASFQIVYTRTMAAETLVGTPDPEEPEAWLHQTLAELLEVDPDALVLERDDELLSVGDSLVLIEAAEAVEERYGVRIEDEELEEAKTVGQFLDMLRRKIGELPED